MSFLSLPTEVIQHIMNQCSPNSFESLVLASKHFHAVGESFISEHNYYKKTFGHVEIRGEWGDNADMCRGLVWLLNVIAADPRAGTYVQTFTMQDFRSDDVLKEEMGLYLGSTKHMDALEPAAWALMANMVSESPWLKAAGCDLAAWKALLVSVQDIDTRLRRVEGGHEVVWRDDDHREVLFPLLVLVLTELTQLTTVNINYNIQFPSSQDEAETVPIMRQAKKVLDLMSSLAGEDDHSSPERVLQGSCKLPKWPSEGLTTLNFCPPTSHYNSIDAAALNPFISLPSLRQLRITNLRIASDLGYTYTWPEGGGVVATESHHSLIAAREYSSIEMLELAHCCIDPVGIASLVERMPHLTTLRYTHQAKGGETERDFTAGWDFDAGRFLKSIACASYWTGTNQKATLTATPANTIKELAIGFEDCYGDVTTGVSGKALQQFTSLKTLALDILIFFGTKPDADDDNDKWPNLDGGDEEQADHALSRQKDEDRALPMARLDADEWEPKMPRLVDFLPPTLESLELFIQRQNMELRCLDSWTQLLDRFREKRPERLPNLKSFVVKENALLHRGLGANGLYQEFEVHDDPRSVQYRRAALEAGAEFISADGAMMSWRQELEKQGDIVHSSGYYTA